jgi:hypothetical protein
VLLGCVPVVRSENLGKKKFTKVQIKTCIVVLMEFEINRSGCLAIGEGADKDMNEWFGLMLRMRNIYNSFEFVLEEMDNYHFEIKW